MSSSDAHFSKVGDHYAQRDLAAMITNALRAAGKDPERLQMEDLAPIDEFHVRGGNATREFARDLGLDRNMKVLDVGSGLGGALRHIAREFGCRGVGLDLSVDYCRVAASITRSLGLESLVSFQQGNALDLPFPDASFDVVWTQHASMNIADKSTLYREMWRVLRPGGRLALYDILAGPGGDVYFPVPWARDPSCSFLSTSQQLLDILAETGFEILIWRDVTEPGRSWFRRTQDKLHKNGSPPLGLHLLLGDDFRKMAHNQFLNLEEGRVTLVEAIMRRPTGY